MDPTEYHGRGNNQKTTNLSWDENIQAKTLTYLDEDPAGPRAQQARGHLPCVLSGSTFCSNRFLQRRTIEVEVVVLDRPLELWQSKQKGPEPAADAVTPDHHRHLRQSSPSTSDTQHKRSQDTRKQQTPKIQSKTHANDQVLVKLHARVYQKTLQNISRQKISLG